MNKEYLLTRIEDYKKEAAIQDVELQKINFMGAEIVKSILSTRAKIDELLKLVEEFDKPLNS